MFGPEAPYERSGDVNDVVFPCGQTIGADGDTINLYYGAADSCMALATGSIRCSSRLAGLKSQFDTYHKSLANRAVRKETAKWEREAGTGPIGSHSFFGSGANVRAAIRFNSRRPKCAPSMACSACLRCTRSGACSVGAVIIGSLWATVRWA